MQKRFIKLLLSLAITIEVIGCSSEIPPAQLLQSAYSSSLNDYMYCNAESCPKPTQFTLDEEEEVKPIYVVPPSVTVKDNLVYKMKVHYDFSQAVLKKSDIKKLEHEFSKLKGQHFRVSVIGYTDNVEAANRKSTFNNKLSMMRAESVKKFLIKHFGINGADISVSGKPLCCYVTSNKSAKGRAENRRAEISIFITHN